MQTGDVDLLVRIAIGFVVTYIIGFERQLRGSPAGDRTFALVGASATAIAAVAGKSSPQAVAGIVTGIGFIGGGVVFQGSRGLIRGLTTAATIFSAAGLGIVIGYGHEVIGIAMAAVLLLTLELQYIPFLRWIDAEHYRGRVRTDRPAPDEPAQPRP